MKIRKLHLGSGWIRYYRPGLRANFTVERKVGVEGALVGYVATDCNVAGMRSAIRCWGSAAFRTTRQPQRDGAYAMPAVSLLMRLLPDEVDHNQTIAP